MAKDAFGLDLSPTGGFIHKREMAKVIASWKESRLQSDTKAKVDAVARAHGEPVSYLPSEWVKMLKTFKDRYGQRIPEYYLPARCYFEAFEERINEGRLRAETLAQVVSLEEEEAQERSKPEDPKQLHLTLEANLTPQTRRRYISSVPKIVEQLRTKYQVQSNVWLLAKLRQPGRALSWTSGRGLCFGRALEQEEFCLPTTAGELRGDGGSRMEPLPRTRVPTPQRRTPN